MARGAQASSHPWCRACARSCTARATMQSGLECSQEPVRAHRPVLPPSQDPGCPLVGALQGRGPAAGVRPPQEGPGRGHAPRALRGQARPCQPLLNVLRAFNQSLVTLLGSLCPHVSWQSLPVLACIPRRCSHAVAWATAGPLWAFAFWH